MAAFAVPFRRYLSHRITSDVTISDGTDRQALPTCAVDDPIAPVVVSHASTFLDLRWDSLVSAATAHGSTGVHAVECIELDRNDLTRFP